MASPETRDKRESESYRVRYAGEARPSAPAPWAWLCMTVVLGLILWGIYVLLVAFDRFNLFGPSLSATCATASMS